MAFFRGRSLRWPMRRNRGFSATPRRNPFRSRSAARKIVRKAGPLEATWFYDTPVTDPAASQNPLLFMSSGVVHDYERGTLIAVNDYSTGEAGSEKVWVDKLNLTFKFATIRNELWMSHSHHCIMLWACTEDDMADDIVTNQMTPEVGDVGQLVAFQDRSRGARLITYKTRTFEHRPDADSTSGVIKDATNFNVGIGAVKPLVNFRTRRFALKEGEQLYWAVSSWHNSDGVEANVADLGGLAGSYWLRAKFLRY